MVNHHTLSDFRIEHGEALQNLFVQVLGILTMEKLVTLDFPGKAACGAGSLRDSPWVLL
ncbi:MAG: hypothetical protein ABSG25_05445 [Bryobacteraceae bacterium]